MAATQLIDYSVVALAMWTAYSAFLHISTHRFNFLKQFQTKQQKRYDVTTIPTFQFDVYSL